MPTQLRLILALAIGVAFIYLIVARWQTGEDPSLRMSVRSDAGYGGGLLSGVTVTALLAVAIGALAWPVVQDSTGLQVFLVGGVAAHWMLEKSEPDR